MGKVGESRSGHALRSKGNCLEEKGKDGYGVSRRPTTVSCHVHGTIVPEDAQFPSLKRAFPSKRANDRLGLFKAPRTIHLHLAGLCRAHSQLGRRSAGRLQDSKDCPNLRRPLRPSLPGLSASARFAVVPPRSGAPRRRNNTKRRR